MSALELSRRSGVARNTIAALEAGEGNPTLDTLYALADALKVPLSDLLERPPAGPRIVRAGEGAHVEGAALDANLIDRGAQPEVAGEREPRVGDRLLDHRAGDSRRLGRERKVRVEVLEPQDVTALGGRGDRVDAEPGDRGEPFGSGECAHVVITSVPAASPPSAS